MPVFDKQKCQTFVLIHKIDPKVEFVNLSPWDI